MARPTTISTDQIVKAAREVFLDCGFSATTAEVARRAGVAEGSIFKRFKTKEELFIAAMTPMGDPEWVRSLPDRLNGKDVRKELLSLGGEMIAFFRKILPVMMMAWSNAGAMDVPEPLRGPDPPPVRAIRALTMYFDAEMRAGRIKRSEPEVLARVFLGSIQNFVFFELLRRSQHVAESISEEDYLRKVIALLWKGMAPSDGAELVRDSAKRVKGRRRGVEE